MFGNDGAVVVKTPEEERNSLKRMLSFALGEEVISPLTLNHSSLMFRFEKNGGNYNEVVTSKRSELETESDYCQLCLLRKMERHHFVLKKI